MKNVCLLAALALSTLLQAQAPQRMSFQAVVRDANQALVENALVGMRISVLQGDPQGPVVYSETHQPVTNAHGLVSLEIGGGTVESGSMEAIDWAEGPFHVRTETDPTGGTAYSITGTQQLLSVPYALYAAQAPGVEGPQGPQGPQGPPGEGPCQVIHTGEGRMVLYNATTAYGFGPNHTSGSGWYTTTLGGTILGAIASDSSIVIYTTTAAYGFGRNITSGSGWSISAYDFAPIAAVASSGRIVVYGASGARGFGFNSTSGSGWRSTVFDAEPVGHLVAGNRIVVYTGSTAYGFGYNGTSGSSWYLNTLNGPVTGTENTR